MTQIDLYVKGAAVEAKVNGVLTGGMVGARVVIHYDGSWEGLHKTLVCRSCSGEKSTQLVRTVVDVGTDAVVAHEVMIPGRTLYLGLEGRSSDGTKVYPTIWAACGKIQPGANAEADPTADATPQVWEQLLLHIGSLDSLQTDAKTNLVEAINEAMTKGNGLHGRDGRGIVSVMGNPDGSWVLSYDDGTTETISNEAYMAVLNRISGLYGEIAGKVQIAPEFANAFAECTDTNKLYVLPDGYIYAYMQTTAPAYTNQIKNAIDTDRTPYNEGKGYKTGWRFNSSKEEVEASGHLITGYIPYTAGQVIRISGYTTSDTPKGYFHVCDSDFSVPANAQVQQLYGTDEGFHYSEDPTAPGTYVLTIDPAKVSNAYLGPALLSSDARYIRVNIESYNEDALKVTLDEEIAETTGCQWTNTGHAFVPADYEDRIITLEETTESNTAELAIQKEQIAALAKGEPVVPGYVITEAESVIDRVIAAQGDRTFTFAAISDMHYGVWSYTDGIVHACQALKYIGDRIDLDAVAVLGDYTDGWPDSGYDDAIADFKAVNSLFENLRFAPNLRLAGNHDIYNDNPALTMRYINAYSDDVVWGSRPDGYFYRDFDGYRIRVIGLNTNMLTTEQYNWFASALDLSEKEDIADWSILVLSHHPLDWMEWIAENPESYCFCHILDGYKKGQSGTVSGTFGGTSGEVHYDFTDGKNAATLIGNIHGHIHNFKVDYIYMDSPDSGVKSDVLRVATPNACYNRENEYEGVWSEDTAYSKEKNTSKDTSFCIYCIDLDACTIKAICYGAGYDRDIDYSYTNDVEPPAWKTMDTETWTFELEDGSTVTKQMVVMV